MTTSRLGIYNGALLICGQRALAALTDNIEPRHLLDTVWNNGGVRYCLEQGQWRFAMRTVQLDYDTAIAPDFGYVRGFSKDSDWVATCAVCEDAYFKSPLLRYQDEGDYLYADLDTIYARFVSDAANFGGDYSKWPESFREYVEHHFAGKIILKLTSDKERQDAILHPKSGSLVRARKVAKNKAAQADPTQFAANGSWINSRGGGRRGPMGDGGNSGSLTG